MAFSVKLVFGDDIRKVPFESLSIPSLYDKIRSLYSELEHTSLDNLYLYYIDDEEDRIRIKFDVELTEAMRQSAVTNARILKIYIVNLDSTAPSIAPTPAPVSNLILSMLSSINTNPYNPAAQQPFQFSPFGASPVNVSSSLHSETYTQPPTIDLCSPTSPEMTYSPKPSTRESSVHASPIFTSVSTNTLIDAKDAATEMPCAVTQMTQTHNNTNAHQMTQTNANHSSATQTAQGSSATQTTQTAHASCVQTTQTTQGCSAQTTQTVPDSVTPYEPPAVSFYDSLAGTQFGALLEKLEELGFTDKQKSVQALVKYEGRLPEAIDELLLDQLLV